MRFFFLVILLLSSRAANSGPLNFGDSTLSEPDDFPLLDGDGNTVDNGKVMELALDSSPSFQFDAFSNQEEANIRPDPQIIPGIANYDAPNLLADLPAAACSDSDRRVKGSAQNNGNLCPANLETPPTRQSTEQDRQQNDPGINPNPDEKKEDGPILNPTPPDDICPPGKKLYCCFGREILNWNSREGCEEFTTLRDCHMRGGFPFCCTVTVGVINAQRLVMEKVGLGCDKDPVTADRFLPPNNIIQFPTIPANVIPLLRNRPPPPSSPSNDPKPPT